VLWGCAQHFVFRLAGCGSAQEGIQHVLCVAVLEKP
jgi:hypothetical protein